MPHFAVQSTGPAKLTKLSWTTHRQQDYLEVDMGDVNHCKNCTPVLCLKMFSQTKTGNEREVKFAIMFASCRC